MPLLPGTQTEDINVRIISPKHDDIWIGVMGIEVQVTGVKPEYLKSVAVYLDGKLVKEFNAPPYRLEYNFGQVPKNIKAYCLGHPTLNEAKKNNIDAEIIPE